MVYRYDQKHRVIAKIELQITNNKELEIVYMQNGNKLAQAMVAYL